MMSQIPLLYRAVHHHRTNLLWRSLNAWQQAPPSHKRAADQLRQKHLLRKGLRSLQWSAMKSRLEIEGAAKKHVEKTLAHHFSIVSILGACVNCCWNCVGFEKMDKFAPKI